MSDDIKTAAPVLLDALRGVLAKIAEPTDVLRSILQQAVSRTGARRGVFVEVGHQGSLVFSVLHRFERDELSGNQGSFSRTLFAEVLRTRKPILIKDAMSDSRFAQAKSVQDMKLVSVLLMPIVVDGRIQGLLHLEKDPPDQFNDAHLDLMRSLVELAAPVLGSLHAGREILEEQEQLRDSANQYRQELDESREILSRDWSFGRFLGRSPTIREMEETVRRACETDFPVLITGETGTGKSLLARILHSSSARSKHSIVTVFCPSLERGMVESELFGHKRGAFTGADTDRTGKVQTAEKGTIFLDEVGELPPAIQPKLLRLLHEKTYERVGDAQEQTANVRVVAATNRNLEADVKAGQFRDDLYQRLNFIPIRVPPLRERREDIPLLLRHTLDSHESGRWIKLDDDAEEFLTRLDYDWSGNVREVEQLGARLVMERPKDAVGPRDLERLLAVDTARLEPGDSSATPFDVPSEGGLPSILAQFERQVLEKTLRESHGLTRSEIAEKLGISERALYKKLKMHGLSG